MERYLKNVMSITTSGFDSFDDFAKQVEKLKESVASDELFASHFMLKYTDFSTFEEFLQKSGFTRGSAEESNEILEREMDVFVVAHTKFISWNEMQAEAWSEWAKEQ